VDGHGLKTINIDIFLFFQVAGARRNYSYLLTYLLRTWPSPIHKSLLPVPNENLYSHYIMVALQSFLNNVK